MLCLLTLHFDMIRIEPGKRNTIALSATKVVADESIRNIKPTYRKCYYPEERDAMVLHTNYSNANCYMECALFEAQQQV